MSAFDRLPNGYRRLCAELSKRMGPITGMPPRRRKLSPQNRRVRFEADHLIAAEKSFTNTVTRQQIRWATRRGLPQPT